MPSVAFLCWLSTSLTVGGHATVALTQSQRLQQQKPHPCGGSATQRLHQPYVPFPNLLHPRQHTQRWTQSPAISPHQFVQLRSFVSSACCELNLSMRHLRLTCSNKFAQAALLGIRSLTLSKFVNLSPSPRAAIASMMLGPISSQKGSV